MYKVLGAVHCWQSCTDCWVIQWQNWGKGKKINKKGKRVDWLILVGQKTEKRKWKNSGQTDRNRQSSDNKLPMKTGKTEKDRACHPNPPQMYIKNFSPFSHIIFSYIIFLNLFFFFCCYQALRRVNFFLLSRQTLSCFSFLDHSNFVFYLNSLRLILTIALAVRLHGFSLSLEWVSASFFSYFFHLQTVCVCLNLPCLPSQGRQSGC